MRPILSIVLVLMIVFAGDAQGDRKTHLPLAIKTMDVIAPNALIHLYLKAPQPDLKQFIKARNGVIKRSVGRYWAVAMPYQYLMELDKAPFVQAIHFELKRGMLLLNESRVHTRVNSVHNGLDGLHSSFTGDGVIIGVVDAGLGLNHPDFLNPDSTTRVLELWDQTINFRRNRSINKHHQSRSRTIYFDHN